MNKFYITGDVSMQRNCDFIQAYISMIADWSAAIKLPIIFEKSIALHYGKTNPRQQYVIDKHVIKSEKYVFDLGVCHSEIFSYEEHVCRTAYKAAKTAEMMLKIFSTRDTDFLKRVYSAYVRLMLEYTSSVWRLSSISLNAILDKVQRRYSKRMNSLKDSSYQRCLSILGLQSWQLLTNRLVYACHKPHLERKICVLCITSRSHIFVAMLSIKNSPIVEQFT